MGIDRVTILDDEGKSIAPNEAAVIVKSVSPASIRYYIRSKGAKTIGDVRKIINDILIYGKNYDVARKLYKTKFGLLSLRQMWGIHDYKDEVSINALSTRVHTRSDER